MSTRARDAGARGGDGERKDGGLCGKNEENGGGWRKSQGQRGDRLMRWRDEEMAGGGGEELMVD